MIEAFNLLWIVPLSGWIGFSISRLLARAAYYERKENEMYEQENRPAGDAGEEDKDKDDKESIDR